MPKQKYCPFERKIDLSERKVYLGDKKVFKEERKLFPADSLHKLIKEHTKKAK